MPLVHGSANGGSPPTARGSSSALTGAAAFGTLFLDRLESFGAVPAYTSGQAFSVCARAPAGTAAAGAVSGLVLRRR